MSSVTLMLVSVCAVGSANDSSVCPAKYVQSNFNGSNTFRTMKICSRQGWFEPLRVYDRARSGGIIRISFRFYSK